MFEYLDLLNSTKRWDVIKNIEIRFPDLSILSDSEGIYSYSFRGRHHRMHSKTIRPPGDTSNVVTYRRRDTYEREGIFPYMGFGYFFSPYHFYTDPIIKSYSPSETGYYTNAYGVAFPFDPNYEFNADDIFERVDPHVISNGRHSIQSYSYHRQQNGLIVRPTGKPMPWTKVITDPEIQEAVALAAHDSDDHKVGYGSWRDGEVIVKKTHKMWRLCYREHVALDVELYWNLLALYEAKLIYKSTLNKCLTQDSMCFTDKRTGIEISATAIGDGENDGYIVHVIPDDEPEMRYIFKEI